MASEHETIDGAETGTPLERMAAQNKALKTELTRMLLEAHGFRPAQGTHTRREIWEDLRGSHPAFSPGYQPTLAEILNRSAGSENWTTIATGEVDDRADPWHRETPEITGWQNTRYQIYQRHKADGEASDALSASEIEAMVRDKFPHVELEEPQAEAAAVRPPETEAERRAKRAPADWAGGVEHNRQYRL